MKRSSLFVSIILCLALLLSLGATGVFAAEEGQEAAFVKNWGMTLNDEIVLKFEMGEIQAGATEIKATVGGRTYTVPASQQIVSVPVYATQMTEAVTLAAVDADGAAVASRSFTVLAYLQSVLDNALFASYHPLVKELLNYGSAAQLHFIGSSDITVSGAGQTAVPGNASAYAIDDQSDLMDCTGASLVYREKIALRFYFDIDPTGCTFTVNGEAAALTVNEAGKYVEIADILPQNLDQQVVLSVTDAEGRAVSVTYSPLTYIIRMSQKGSDTTKALVKALYNYHLAAKAFVPLTDFVVSFNLGYNGEAIADRTIAVGDPYGQLPTPADRVGYTFGGWYTDAACTGEAVTAETLVTSSHTLYAKWTMAEDTSSVTITARDANNLSVTRSIVNGENIYTLTTVGVKSPGTSSWQWTALATAPDNTHTHMAVTFKFNFAYAADGVTPIDPTMTVYRGNAINSGLNMWIYDAETGKKVDSGNLKAALELDKWYTVVIENPTGALQTSYHLRPCFAYAGAAQFSIDVKDRAIYTSGGEKITTPGAMADAGMLWNETDGWHWFVYNNENSIAADQRNANIVLPEDGAIGLEYEVKFNSLSGDAAAYVGLMQGVNTFYDLETGALVGTSNSARLELGKWYRVVYKTNNAANMGTSAWTFGYIGGFSAGNASVSMRNFEALYPAQSKVSFDVNYTGGEAIDAITVKQGAAYGTLPTPAAREGCTFGGWYTNAACTGSAVTASTTVSASHTLYAKWELPSDTNPVQVGVRDANNLKMSVDYVNGEHIYTTTTRGVSSPGTGAWQWGTQINVPAGTQYFAVTFRIMEAYAEDGVTPIDPTMSAWQTNLTSGTSAQIYDAETGVMVSNDNGNYARGQKLELGKWYTIVSTAPSANGRHFLFPCQQYSGKALITMEIKGRSCVEDFRNGYVVTTPGSMANPTVAYTTVDGWHQYIPNSGSAITAENRSVVVTIPTDGAIKLSYEAKINSISGDATSKVGLYGAVSQQIYDLETGKLVGEGNTFNWEIGKWYKIVTYKSDNGNLGTKYTFGYAGDAAHNAGNASVSFRNFEAIYPEKLEVSFSLNYEGATGAPATIQVAAGSAYGILPSPTLEQTRSVKRASDNKLMYYSFAGWYLDAECTGEPVKPTDVVDQSRTLYAKWDNVSFLPRGTGYQNPTFQYVEGEWVTVLKSSGTGNDAENKRLNVFLPESPVYGVASKVMVKNDSDAAITYTHNGNNACFIYDSNWKLVFSAVIGGSANATLQLNEGEWYTFVYAQATSDGNYNNNMAGTDGNYWGLGGFNDANNDVTIYIKDAQIQPEMMEPIAGTEVGAGDLAAPAHVYVDGQWMYLSATSGEENSEYKRYFKVVTLDKTATQFSVKVKMTNFTGSAVPGYGPTGSLTAKIYDPDGNEVSAGALKADVWYTFVHSKNGEVLSSDWYHLGGFGKGKGGLDIYFKDVVFSSPEYQLSFDLNYVGAGEGPAKISLEEGAAYGTLPTPTREQTQVTTSGGYTFYYGFGGWYTNAECTGEAVKPSDIADASRTLYAKWVKASLMPRATNSVYSDPTLQYIEGEWVYVYANNGTARTSAEQERLNLHLPEKIVCAVSYKVMLTNETDAALFYTDSGNLGVDVYDPNGNLLYSRNYKNGGTTTQVTLEEGKWYTVVHSNRDSSTYYDAGQNYYGVGAYGDGAGGATVYVKDISIATDAPSVGGAYFYSRVTTALADKMPRYIDGEWTWAYIGNNLSSSWANRILYLVVNEPNVETVTCKIMMNNCTGAAVPRYYRGATAHARIWDENGQLISDKVARGGQVALEAGKWYTFEFGAVDDATNNQLTVDVAKEWNAIYCGDGTGGMDVYVKDIVINPAS